MSNLLDYIRWRGDLSFKAAPFCEVDGLIFTQLSFLDLDAVFSLDEENSLSALEKKFFTHFDRATYRLGIYFPVAMPELLTLCAQSERFRDTRLLDLEIVRDPEKKIQFAAMTFLLPDKTLFVAYRGTDDTLYGWYESLSLGVYPELPIHALAKAYLARVTAKYPFRRLRIGGHSKGGHLALYAALSLDKHYHRRILTVYNIDGPGFYEDICKGEAYDALAPLIFSVTPYISIVGALLNRHGTVDIVASDGEGVFQHDVFNWHVEGTALVRIPDRSAESYQFEQSMKAWLEKMSDDDKVKTLDTLYKLLTSAGATTISEISEDKLNSALQFGKTLLTLDKETRTAVSRAVMLLLKERKNAIRQQKEAQKQQKKAKKDSDATSAESES